MCVPSSGAIWTGHFTSYKRRTDRELATIAGHGLTTGQALTYDSGLNLGGVPRAAVGGLVDGETYYALVTDGDNFQLTRSPVLDLDPSGTNAAASHTLTPVQSVTFSLESIRNKTITLPGHGFAHGDTVVYDR